MEFAEGCPCRVTTKRGSCGEYLATHKVSEILRIMLSPIDTEPLDVNGNEVKHTGHPGLKGYANIMRSSATQVGCAWADCGTYGYFSYRITDEEDLDENTNIYEAGYGGCHCDSGVCDDPGLCVKPILPTESTTTPTTLVTTTAAVMITAATIATKKEAFTTPLAATTARSNAIFPHPSHSGTL
ncbi:unnamed protein product [Strongylus vulgaris]|uniref:SCP domain-containing protein n=1 Tax=Strongylus vulgaris TaxID=40348 RepID=A0A3P7J5X4_STRVU|nr:unnamed protein product [Strongylus vulgaris]